MENRGRMCAMENGRSSSGKKDTSDCEIPSVAAGEIAAICKTHGNDKHRMLDILRDVQDRYRCISPSALKRIAEATGLTRIEVEGVASFYSFLSPDAQGTHQHSSLRRHCGSLHGAGSCHFCL